MRWFLIASVAFHLALFALMMWIQRPGTLRRSSPFTKVGEINRDQAATNEPKTRTFEVELIVPAPKSAGSPKVSDLVPALAPTGQRAVKKAPPPRAAAGKPVGFKLRPVPGYQIQISPSFMGSSGSSGSSAPASASPKETPNREDAVPAPAPPGFQPTSPRAGSGN